MKQFLTKVSLFLVLVLFFSGCIEFHPPDNSGTGNNSNNDGGVTLPPPSGGNDRASETYSGTKSNVEYTLVISPPPGKAVLAGDDYRLTGGAAGKTSTGMVSAIANGVFTLKPSNNNAPTFTVAFSGTKISSISGTITFSDGTTEQGPGSFASSGGGGRWWWE